MLSLFRYVRSEEETFSLFNYIQTQNQETDWTLERHARLKEEIKTYEEQLSEEESERAEAMADLQGKWRNAKEAHDECFHAAQDAQRMLDRIAKKIQSLFFKIQCDQILASGTRESGKGSKLNGQKPFVGRSDNRLALLCGQGVTESNILAYAELIEQRALEIMSDYTKRTRYRDQGQTNENDPKTASADSPKSSFGVSQMDVVKPPEVDTEDDDNDDEDGRPIALAEMRRRTAEMLAKKQQGSKMTAKRKDQQFQGRVGVVAKA